MRKQYFSFLLSFKQIKNSNKGQSIIELMVIFTAFLTFIKYMFMLFWLYISVLWMEHQLYQGLLCAAQQKNRGRCEALVRQQIKKLNPLGFIKILKIKKNHKEWKGEIHWHFYKKNFLIRQSLSLPY